MSRFSPVALGLLCLAALTGCDHGDPSFPLEPLTPDATRPAILDGRDPEFAGSGVYFLPPIGDNAFEMTAPFDPNLDPRVEICELDNAEMTAASIEAADCVGTPIWFETDAAWSASAPQVQVAYDPLTGDGQYSLGWNTVASDAGKAFRITVLLPDLDVDPTTQAITVGYRTAASADVALFENASTKIDGDVVGWNAGQNFPAKFKASEQAQCSGEDCFAYRVTCQGGTFRTDHAGLYFPEDWEQTCDPSDPGPEHNFFAFQERTDGECVPFAENGINAIPIQPCYVWQIFEEIDTGNGTGFNVYTDNFAQDILVQFCPDPDLLEEGGNFHAFLGLASIWRYSTGGADPGVANLPESAVAAFENQVCPYPGDAQNGQILSFLRDLARPALRLFGVEPRALYAGDGGTLTGKTGRTSHFQYGIGLDVNFVASNLTGIVSATVPVEVSVALAPHPGSLEDPEPLSGATVTLSYSGGGSYTLSCVEAGCEATTGSDGLATVNVVFPSTAQTGQITATVTYDGQVIGSAIVGFTAIDLEATFLEPLDTGSAASTEELFAPTVHICAAAEGAAPAHCDAGDAEVVFTGSAIKLVEQNGRKFFQTDWKPRDTSSPLGWYYVEVLAEGASIGFSPPVVVTKGGKGDRKSVV